MWNLFLQLAFKPYLAEHFFAHPNFIFRIKFLRFRTEIGKISSLQFMIAKFSALKVSTLYLTCQYALVKLSRLKATVNIHLHLDGVFWSFLK